MSESTQRLGKEWKEALQALRDYSVEQRDRAVENAEGLLDKTDAHIDRLEQQLEEDWDNMSATTREERRAALRNLREQRQKLAEWYGGLKHGSAKGWHEITDGFGKAYGTLADSFSRAAESLREKKSEDSES